MTTSGYNPTRDGKISDTRYKGKVCEAHPELEGERAIRTYLCVGCTREKKQGRRNVVSLQKPNSVVSREAMVMTEEKLLAMTRMVAKRLARDAGKSDDDWGDYWNDAREEMARSTGGA